MVQVKKHSRKLKSGKTVSVKSHFRKVRHQIQFSNKSIKNEKLKEYEATIKKSFDQWLEECGKFEDVIAIYDYDTSEEAYRVEGEYNQMQKNMRRKSTWDDLTAKEKETKINEFIYEELREKYYEWISKYSDFEFPLTLYREITTNNLDFNSIGVYWSDYKECAKAHWGEVGKGVIVEAKINPNDIDWKCTLRSNMDRFIGEREQEVHLKHDREIDITKIITSYSEKKLSSGTKGVT